MEADLQSDVEEEEEEELLGESDTDGGGSAMEVQGDPAEGFDSNACSDSDLDDLNIGLAENVMLVKSKKAVQRAVHAVLGFHLSFHMHGVDIVGHVAQ